jgi:NAD(P)-dependent dehydrogenase (short-subunit alcohol dehydrogenase family)
MALSMTLNGLVLILYSCNMTVFCNVHGQNTCGHLVQSSATVLVTRLAVQEPYCTWCNSLSETNFATCQMMIRSSACLMYNLIISLFFCAAFQMIQEAMSLMGGKGGGGMPDVSALAGMMGAGGNGSSSSGRGGAREPFKGFADEDA